MKGSISSLLTICLQLVSVYRIGPHEFVHLFTHIDVMRIWIFKNITSWKLTFLRKRNRFQDRLLWARDFGALKSRSRCEQKTLNLSETLSKHYYLLNSRKSRKWTKRKTRNMMRHQMPTSLGKDRTKISQWPKTTEISQKSVLWHPKSLKENHRWKPWARGIEIVVNN